MMPTKVPEINPELLRDFLGAAPMDVYLKDAAGRYLWVNDQAARTFGLAGPEWVGKTAYDVVDPEAAARISRYDAQTLAESTPRVAEVYQRWPSGLRRVLSYRFPFRDNQGQLLLAGISIDMTKPHQANEDRTQLLAELHAQRREAERQTGLLTSILDHLVQGVTVVRADGSVLLRNRVSQQLTGMPSDGPLARLRQPDDSPLPPGEESAFRRVIGGEELREVEYLLCPPEGAPALIELNSRLLSLPDEEPMVIHSFRDISELRRLEQAREQYLKVMTHDLRSPLAVISAGAELIQTRAKKDPVAVEGLAARIIAAVRQIDLLLAGLADSATLEAGQLHLRLESVELRTLLARIIQHYRTVLPTERVDLDGGCEPIVLRADPGRLERVIVNLLSNALKFSEADTRVTVTMCQTDNEARIEVIDLGIGIDQVDLSRLFAPHFRTAGGRAWVGGSGLGLYIVKGLVEAHHGRVSVSSEAGRGTTVTVAIPLKPPPAQTC